VALPTRARLQPCSIRRRRQKEWDHPFLFSGEFVDIVHFRSDSFRKGRFHGNFLETARDKLLTIVVFLKAHKLSV
jgi:hypothetical protein